MPGDCTLLSLDASHAIPTRVLRFEDSGLRRRTPVRTAGAAAAPPSVLRSWLCGLLTVKIRQPSHEFTFYVGITFVSYSLVLTPVV
jgi:hypothetical protein